MFKKGSRSACGFCCLKLYNSWSPCLVNSCWPIFLNISANASWSDLVKRGIFPPDPKLLDPGIPDVGLLPFLMCSAAVFSFPMPLQGKSKIFNQGNYSIRYYLAGFYKFKYQEIFAFTKNMSLESFAISRNFCFNNSNKSIN